jgi:hypothetical protein
MDPMNVRNESKELARLSRSVSRLRWTSAALVAVNAVLLLGAMRPADEVVKARRFSVVDEAGNTIATLGKLDGVLVGLNVGDGVSGQSARLAIVPAGKGHGGAAMLTITSGGEKPGDEHSEVSLASTPIGTHLGFSVERKDGSKEQKASLSLVASQEEVAIRGKNLGKEDGFKLPE